MLTEASIRAFLVAECGVPEEELAPDVSLFQSGLLDSFTMVDLIGFLETTAGIRIKASEVSLANLDSIDAITRFVKGKTGA